MIFQATCINKSGFIINDIKRLIVLGVHFLSYHAFEALRIGSRMFFVLKSVLLFFFHYANRTLCKPNILHVLVKFQEGFF